MRIRDDQITTLFEEALARFAPAVCSHVRAEQTNLGAGLTDEELLRQVRAALVRGNALALTGDALVAYTMLALQLGPEFDQQATFNDILADVTRPSEMRLAMLRTVINAADLEEAKARGGR